MPPEVELLPDVQGRADAQHQEPGDGESGLGSPVSLQGKPGTARALVPATFRNSVLRPLLGPKRWVVSRLEARSNCLLSVHPPRAHLPTWGVALGATVPALTDPRLIGTSWLLEPGAAPPPRACSAGLAPERPLDWEAG